MPCILSLSLSKESLRDWPCFWDIDILGLTRFHPKENFCVLMELHWDTQNKSSNLTLLTNVHKLAHTFHQRKKKWPRVGCSHSTYDPLRYHLSNRCSPKGCAIGVELSSWKLKCEVELSEQMWLKGSQTNETTHSVNHLTLLLQKRLVREDYLFSFSYLSWLHIDSSIIIAQFQDEFGVDEIERFGFTRFRKGTRFINQVNYVTKSTIFVTLTKKAQRSLYWI